MESGGCSLIVLRREIKMLTTVVLVLAGVALVLFIVRR